MLVSLTPRSRCCKFQPGPVQDWDNTGYKQPSRFSMSIETLRLPLSGALILSMLTKALIPLWCTCATVWVILIQVARLKLPSASAAAALATQTWEGWPRHLLHCSPRQGPPIPTSPACSQFTGTEVQCKLERCRWNRGQHSEGHMVVLDTQFSKH